MTDYFDEEDLDNDIGDLFNNDKYEQIINPRNLFDSKEEFLEFISTDPTKENLQSTLTICEQEELYEFCVIIRDKLKEYE